MFQARGGRPASRAGIVGGLLVALAIGLVALAPPGSLGAGSSARAAVRQVTTSRSPDQTFVARLTKVQVTGQTACPGSTIAYTLILQNLSDPGTGRQRASLRDPIPEVTTYVPGSVSGQADYNAAENRIEWDGFLSPGEEVTTGFEVTVGSGVAVGTMIPNTAQGTLGNQAPASTTTAEVKCPTPTPTPPVPALPRGLGNSTLVLYNANAEQQTIGLTLTNAVTGQRHAADPVPLLPRGTIVLSGTVLLPDEIGLFGAQSPDTSVKPIVAVTWDDSGGAMAVDEAVVSTDVVLPKVVKGARGEYSTIVIVSADDDPLAVFDFELQTGTGEVVDSGQVPVGSGGSVVVDMGSHELFADLLATFDGRMRIRGPSGAVHSFVWNQYDHRPVYDIAAIPLASASRELHYPSVYSRWPTSGSAGSLSSFVAISNLGSRSTDLNLTYYGTGGACTGQRYIAGPVTIFAGWTAALSLSDSRFHPLPSNCAGGLAVSSSRSDVVGYLTDISNDVGPSSYRGASSYSGFTNADAARNIVLPLVRQTPKVDSFINVQNVGTGASAVSLTYYDEDGSTGRGTYTVPGGGGQRIAVADLPGIHEPSNGWALVEASRPVVAVVDLLSRDAGLDHMAYRGVDVDRGAHDLHLPIFPIRYAIGPTPTATPTLATVTTTPPLVTVTSTRTPTNGATSPSTRTPTPTPGTPRPGDSIYWLYLPYGSRAAGS